jgi:hypothetical protein
MAVTTQPYALAREEGEGLWFLVHNQATSWGMDRCS